MLFKGVIRLDDRVWGRPLTFAACSLAVLAAGCVRRGPAAALRSPRRFQGPAEWVAYAGTTRLSGSEASAVRARVAQVITHPAYNADTADFDVAVLRLRSPLPLSRHVQPVCLPAASHAFPPRSKCLISGWGYLREDFRKRPAPAPHPVRRPQPRSPRPRAPARAS